MFVKPHPEAKVYLGPHTGPDGKPGPETVPLTVLHPHMRAPIPAEGMEVPEDAYWLRRLRDGDVIRAEASAAAAPVEEAPALPAPAAPESGHEEA